MLNWLKTLTPRARKLAVSGLVAGGLAVALVVGATGYNLYVLAFVPGGSYIGLSSIDLGETPTSEPKPSETPTDSGDTPTPEPTAPIETSAPPTSPTPRPSSSQASFGGSAPSPSASTATVPLAPASLSATLETSTTFSLSWGRPSNWETSQLLRYEVTYSRQGGNGTACSVSAARLSCVAYNVRGTGSIEFAVRAVGSSGTSPWTYFTYVITDPTDPPIGG